ncbi:hypothetical protein C8Q80DRAFT_1266878 [Daedaleopsis nitida]|nr:hypothetical protein C8Q80DRAFT_1266878 [Daedaleopsis nitida]
MFASSPGTQVDTAATGNATSSDQSPNAPIESSWESQPAPVTPLKRDLTSTPNQTSARPHKRPRKSDPPQTGRELELRSPSLYHPTGNVVIRVHTTLFKLDRATLAQQCTYFSKLFKSSKSNDAPYEVIERCRVYSVPKELIVGDFTRLLSALKDPQSYFEQTLTHPVAVSLLRAAHRLSCTLVIVLARIQLTAIWDSRVPPPPVCIPSTSPTDDEEPDDTDADDSVNAAFGSDDGPSHPEAIHMLSVAREYSIPLEPVEKRVLYTLLSSRAFWAALSTDRTQIALGNDMLCRLYHARDALQRAWRAFILTPPRGAMCRCMVSVDRVRMWKARVTEENNGLLEECAEDPIRLDVFRGAKRRVFEWPWCAQCLQERENEWKKKRMEWWKKLDEWLNFAT